MPLPKDWLVFLSSLDDSHIFASEQMLGELVIFASEAKRIHTVAAERQLTLDLYSAQNQRRTLGFDDSYVFGATVVGTTLMMYCSMWECERVVRFSDLLIFSSQF
jgi:hypothetical protein